MASLTGIGAAVAATYLSALYVDARYGITEDLRQMSALRRATRRITEAERLQKSSLFQVLEKNAQECPNAPSLYYAADGTEETWSSTYRTVLHFTSYLVEKGVCAGDIVAIDHTNKLAFIHLWLALAALGSIPAFLNYNLTGSPLLHCLKVCNTKLLIVDYDVANMVIPIETEVSQMGVSIEYLTPAELARIATLPPTRPEDNSTSIRKMTDASCIFYTSGTTGLPKPAVFSLSRWWGAGLMIGDVLKIKKEDRFYTCMPLYHGTGSSCFAMCLFQQNCFCLGYKFSVSNFWRDVRTSRATMINYVGETCRYLLNAPPSPDDRDNLVHSAYGNGLRPDVWEAFRTRFGITNVLEFYGASEALFALLNYNSGPYGAGAVGKHGVLQRITSRHSLTAIKVDKDTLAPIRTANGMCIPVGPNEPGELLQRIPDPTMYPGYFNDPVASEKKVLRNVYSIGDMWFRSGDLLKRTPDGMWFFLDRMGDTFRWKSENVSTTEVSEAIGKFPGIAEVNVYGVQLPGHDGRAGCAAIRMEGDAKLNLRDLALFAKQSLPKYAVPLFIRTTKEIRRTENNKQLKEGLKKEGVNVHHITGGDALYWLKGGVSGSEYVAFTKKHWRDLEAGAVSL